MALERMSAVDTAWLHMDLPNDPADIVTLMTFDGPLSYEDLKATVAERMLRKHHRFAQRVVEVDGHPHWQDDPEFDIEHHVLRYQASAPITEDSLRDIVMELGNQPLSPNRPLWAIHLIEGSGGPSAIVARLHHCIADGFALAHAMLNLADQDEAVPAEELHEAVTDHEPFRNVLAHEVEELIRHPSHALDLAKQAAALAKSLGHLLLLPFDKRTLLKKKLVGHRHMAWSSNISLDSIKSIGRSSDATVNDVLVSAMTGALRRFLAEAGEPVDELSVRAIIPLNLRPVHWIEEMDDSMGNRFGLVFLDLPVHEETPESRMRTLKERMDAIKGTPEAVVAFGILNAIGHTPATVEHIINEVFGLKASLVVTNVPGPRKPLYFNKQRVRDVMFWVPHPAKLGMGLSILSYAGTIVVGVRTDEAISDNPGRLVELFEQEISAMLEDASA